MSGKTDGAGRAGDITGEKRLVRLQSVRVVEIIGTRQVELNYYVYEGADDSEAVEEVIRRVSEIRLNHYRATRVVREGGE